MHIYDCLISIFNFVRTTAASLWRDKLRNYKEYNLCRKEKCKYFHIQNYFQAPVDKIKMIECVHSMNLLLKRPCSESRSGITYWNLRKHWDKAHLYGFFHIHWTHYTDRHLVNPDDASKIMDSRHRIQPWSIKNRYNKILKLLFQVHNYFITVNLWRLSFFKHMNAW